MKKFEKIEVLEILKRNGIDEDYLEEMEGVESGGDEWMEVLCDIVGKNVYVEDLNEEEDELVSGFVDVMINDLGIDWV